MCGKESEFSVLTSTNCFGSPDLDLRPAQMQRSTMNLWVQRCPECGFVSEQVSDSCKVTKDFIESCDYINSDGCQFKSFLADAFYKQYMILLESKKHVDAYSALLHCAWACDDKWDTENAIKIRKKMVSLFPCLPTTKRKNPNIVAQYVDVLRRSGNFDKIIIDFENYEVDNEIIKKVIDFQVELSKEKDNRVYTVSDVLK